MIQLKVYTNPAAIFEAIVSQGLSMSEAADKAGIHVKTFSTLANRDVSITTKTAAKLRRAFGDSAVTITQSLKGGE